MIQLYDDLYQTKVENPFSNLNTHAYFLIRKEGNVLFYNTSSSQEIKEISEKGGIVFQYLSHRHEVGDSLRVIRDKFCSKLCADQKEVPSISKTCPVDVKFSERVIHSNNIEVIPTAGHTAGGLCFYYTSPNGLNYLFTGDLIFPRNGEWCVILISNDGANRENLVKSLLIIRELKPDIVLSSASVGDISVVKVNEKEWQNAIDKNIKALSSN